MSPRAASLATAGVSVAVGVLGRGAGPWVDAALAGAVLAACLAVPALGAPAFVAACLVCPFAIPTGTLTAVEAPFVLLPVLLAVCAVRSPWRQAHGSAAVWGVGALAATASLSFALSGWPWLTFVPRSAPLMARLGGLAVYLGSAGAFVLGVVLLSDARWLRRTVALFLAIGTVYLTIWHVPAVGHALPGLFPQGADGSAFWVWLVALAFAFAGLGRAVSPGIRLGLAGVVLAAFLVALGPSEDWVSGWLPPLVAVAGMVLFRNPRLAVLVGVAAVAAVPLLWPILRSVDNTYSLVTRVAAWRIVGEIGLVNPLIGLGPANYHPNTSRFEILGWYVPFSSHNAYVDLFAETGLVGIGCFGWIVGALVRDGWHVTRLAHDAFVRTYGHAAVGALAGMLAAGMLADWIFPLVYNVTLRGFRASAVAWLLLGGLAGAALHRPASSG